jgi:hypothetical protein
MILQNFRIYLNTTQNKVESANNELTLTATRDLNGIIITCQGENSIATTLLNQTLNIICNKSFLYFFLLQIHQFFLFKTRQDLLKHQMKF